MAQVQYRNDVERINKLTSIIARHGLVKSSARGATSGEYLVKAVDYDALMDKLRVFFKEEKGAKASAS